MTVTQGGEHLYTRSMWTSTGTHKEAGTFNFPSRWPNDTMRHSQCCCDRMKQAADSTLTLVHNTYANGRKQLKHSTYSSCIHTASCCSKLPAHSCIVPFLVSVLGAQGKKVLGTCPDDMMVQTQPRHLLQLHYIPSVCTPRSAKQLLFCTVGCTLSKKRCQNVSPLKGVGKASRL